MYPLKIKEKYDKNNLEKLSYRYSVPYLGNYISGDYRENVGSHLGVDIIPITPNQDVLSILDGKVYKSGENSSYGKFVFIEHNNVPDPLNLNNTTTLYSCYEHLSEVYVNDGDLLKEGDIIGKTGNTGISTGEHLHFQIDRKEAPFHAYWPYTVAEATEKGVNFSEGVNLGLGMQKAKMYTTNPLSYLDLIGKGINKTTGNLVTSNNENKYESGSNINNNDFSEKQVFKDINKDNKYYKFANILNQKGIITGYSDGTFKGNNNISRIEFIKILLLYNETRLSNDTNNYFSDVSIDWQKKYVNTMLNLGIISKNKNFNPNGNISRVEALKISITFLYGKIENNYLGNLIDIKREDWFSKYVDFSIKRNILMPEGNKFYPDKAITRFEVLNILSKLKTNNNIIL